MVSPLLSSTFTPLSFFPPPDAGLLFHPPQVSYLFSPLYSSPLQHITSGLQSPTYNFLYSRLCPLCCSPATFLISRKKTTIEIAPKNKHKNAPTKYAPLQLLWLRQVCLYLQLCTVIMMEIMTVKVSLFDTFVKRSLLSHWALWLGSDRHWSVHEHQNRAALTQPLYSSALMRSVCVLVQLSLWEPFWVLDLGSEDILTGPHFQSDPHGFRLI